MGQFSVEIPPESGSVLSATQQLFKDWRRIVRLLCARYGHRASVVSDWEADICDLRARDEKEWRGHVDT